MSVVSPYPWHQDRWLQLNKVVGSARLSHGLLLAGPEGVGKRRFVQAFSGYGLCHSRGVDDDAACGKCKSCLLIAAKTHPDLLWIAPEDNARAIKVDQVRGLIDFANKTSQLGGLKIVVIEPAEAMNSNASNALLKVLEEPAIDTFLILITDAPGRLLPTIRSRCMQISFAIPPLSQVLPWLESAIGNVDSASRLLRLARGRPLAAMRMHEDNSLDVRKKLAVSWESLWSGKGGPLAVATQWGEFELDALLELLELWLQDLLRWNQCKDSALLVDEEVCQRVAPLLGDDAGASLCILSLLGDVSDLQRQLATGANPNKQLLLEQLAMSVVSKHRRKI